MPPVFRECDCSYKKQKKFNQISKHRRLRSFRSFNPDTLHKQSLVNQYKPKSEKTKKDKSKHRRLGSLRSFNPYTLSKQNLLNQHKSKSERTKRDKSKQKRSKKRRSKKKRSNQERSKKRRFGSFKFFNPDTLPKQSLVNLSWKFSCSV